MSNIMIIEYILLFCIWMNHRSDIVLTTNIFKYWQLPSYSTFPLSYFLLYLLCSIFFCHRPVFKLVVRAEVYTVYIYYTIYFFSLVYPVPVCFSAGVCFLLMWMRQAPCFNFESMLNIIDVSMKLSRAISCIPVVLATCIFPFTNRMSQVALKMWIDHCALCS